MQRSAPTPGNRSGLLQCTTLPNSRPPRAIARPHRVAVHVLDQLSRVHEVQQELVCFRLEVLDMDALLTRATFRETTIIFGFEIAPSGKNELVHLEGH